MLKNVVFACLTIVCFILQTCVFGMIPLIHTVPNLMIVMTACSGFMRGEKTGLFIGFFGGLLIDIFFGEILGFHALLMMYLGFFNGKFYEIFFKEDVKLPLLLVVISDLTYGFLYYVFWFLLRGRTDFIYYLVNVILPEAVYTILATFFLYPVILNINIWLEDLERRSEQKFV